MLRTLNNFFFFIPGGKLIVPPYCCQGKLTFWPGNIPELFPPDPQVFVSQYFWGGNPEVLGVEYSKNIPDYTLLGLFNINIFWETTKNNLLT